MESSLCSMNSDLLVDIMSCVDGAMLAATACTCSGLRDAATDQSLWQNLCHSTWPSTSLKQAQRLISSSHVRGFDKFYADSFPLILWDQEASGVHSHWSASQHQNRATHISPSDFLSLVDVYCQGKCILSRVVDGIPEAVDVYDHDDDNIANLWDFPNNDNQQWFSNCPFRLDVLASTHNIRDARNDIEIENAYSDHHSTNDDCCITYLPSIYSSEVDDGSRKGDLCEKLAKGVRLSWILLDKKRGKAVNLSSWKPLSVQRSWPSYGDYVLHFGSTISVEASVLPQKLAECIILARCELVEKGGYVKWKEVSMRLKDDVGAHVNAKKSLMALNQALYSLRTVKHLEVERRHVQYKQHKIEMKRRQDQIESLTDNLYALLEIAIFSAICYGCSLLF